MKIQPPSPDDALKMLARRVDGFPISVALFCYAWSGALPRDIIRTARSCVHIAKQAGRPVGVAELVPQIIRQDVAEAIDDAIIKDLESKNAVSIDGILSLRHQVRDDNSLQAVLGACELKEAARVSNGTPEDADMLRRLSVYMAIGSLVLEYFSASISALLADDFGQVLGVVEDLANAKAALATYPAEAVWFLDRARSKMGLHVKTGSHVPDRPGEL